MIKIAVVVPLEEMVELAKKTFAEHTDYMRARFQDDTEYSLDVLVVDTTKNLLKKMPDCDAMIVRGATYRDLSRRGSPVPLVELITTGTDIVNIFLKLRQQYGNLPAAILGTPNMILGIEKISNQLGVDVTPYFLEENSQEDLIQNVNRAFADGKKILIGGRISSGHAKTLGMETMLITSGRDAFWNAFSEAKQLAKISIKEREKALAFKTLLDNAYEGLVAVDHDGRISFINVSAVRILQLDSREQHIGKRFSEIIPSFSLNRILRAPEEYVDEIVEYKQTHLSVKKMNLLMSGNQIGQVFTFLNASQIQATEGKLRGRLYQKGHTAKYSFDELIVQSPRMAECIQEAKAFAKTDSNVMIVGESGTGKELISQSIHNMSRRAGKNFVAINCAALPENLLESELFGYVEGAFTGASRGGKPGLFEVAHQGTIFLDEISEIPLPLQGRLLRVLQEREIMRLGDNKITPIDIRVIAATNKDLMQLVQSGQFRSDLYYRLYVLQLNLPPLRERHEDIPILVESFVKQFCEREALDVPLQLSQEDYRLLQEQPWNGNIRELRNFCERLAVLYQPGTDVTGLILHLLGRPSPIQSTNIITTPVPTDRRFCPDDFQTILEVIEKCGGNKTKAAMQLGISRVTLWRLLKRIEENQG